MTFQSPKYQKLNIKLILLSQICPSQGPNFKSSNKRHDSVLQAVITFAKNGWPESFSECPSTAKLFYNVKEELSLADGVLLKVDRVVVPSSMRADMLKCIHEGHIGIEKSKARAREVMYWSRMNTEIEDYISKCSICL